MTPNSPKTQYNSPFAQNAAGMGLPESIRDEIKELLGLNNPLGGLEKFREELYAVVQLRTSKILKDAEKFFSVLSQGSVASGVKSVDPSSENKDKDNKEKQTTEILKNVSSIKVSIEGVDEQNRDIKKNTEVSASVANVNEENVREQESKDDRFQNTLIDYLDKILRQLKKATSAEDGGFLGKLGSALGSNAGLLATGAGGIAAGMAAKSRAAKLAKIKAARAARGKGGKVAGIARAIKNAPGKGKTKLLLGLLAAMGIYTVFSGSEEEDVEETVPVGDEELPEEIGEVYPTQPKEEYGVGDFATDAALMGVVSTGSAAIDYARGVPAATATQAATTTTTGTQAVTKAVSSAGKGAAAEGAAKTGSRFLGKAAGPLTALIEGGLAYFEYQAEEEQLTQDVQAGIVTEAEKDAREDRMMGEKIGQAAGATTGALAGMAAGAAIGSVVPVAGTIIGAAAGAIIGAGLGWLGGWAGGELGGQIAEAVDDTTLTQEQIDERRAKYQIIDSNGIVLTSTSETEVNLETEEALRTLNDIKDQSIRDSTESNTQTTINNNVVSGSGNTQNNTEVNNPNHSENPANSESVVAETAAGNNQGTMPS